MSAEPARQTPHVVSSSVLWKVPKTDPRPYELYHPSYVEYAERELIALTAKLERAERELQGAREALEEIHRESVGALNNAFPEDAPEIVESLGCKAELALKALQPAADGAAEGAGKS